MGGAGCGTGMIMMLGSMSVSGAPFGRSDPEFNSPQFTVRGYPGYCVYDARGGLLWSFENIPPYTVYLNGADAIRVGGLVRTTMDGVVDRDFKTGPDLQNTLGILVQPDGRILVGGRWVGDLNTNGAPNYRVFRYLTNGIPDSSYQSPAFGRAPRFLTLQPDGKLLVSDTLLTGLVRLNPNGSLDMTFQTAALKAAYEGFGVFAPPVSDNDGFIYIAGGFTKVNGQDRQGVARLHPDGTLDGTFVPGGYTFSTFVRGLVLQPGNKVVIAGRLKLNSTGVDYPLLR